MDTPKPKTNDERADVPEGRVKKTSNKRWLFSPIGITILLLVLAVVIFQLWLTRYKRWNHPASRYAMRNAYQIQVGLTAYANSNEGVFPNETETGESPTYSNDVLRLLFVTDLGDDELLFHIHGHPIHVGRKPDGNIGTPENGYKEALGPGENAFDYSPGLTLDRHPTNLPILRTKLPDGREVVVRIGGSSKVEKPGTSESLFAAQKWLLPTPVGAK